MKYPIAIEPASATKIFGVMIPDLRGCISAGDSLEEAFANAKEAAEGWIEAARAHKEKIPQPSSIRKIMKNPDLKGWLFGFIDINPNGLSGKA